MDEPPEQLVLFDFDGTLCRLATDYQGLRTELEALAGSRAVQDEGLLTLALRLGGDPRAQEALTRAELKDWSRAGRSRAVSSSTFRLRRKAR